MASAAAVTAAAATLDRDQPSTYTYVATGLRDEMEEWVWVRWVRMPVPVPPRY